MDTMVLWWVIVVLGMNAESSWAIMKEYKNKSSDKNDSTVPSVMKDISQTFKSKRQLHDFDFDVSSFDEPMFSKMSGLSTFSDDDISDLSVFIPSSSFKVTRSNSDSLGTHGEAFEASNMSPSSSYVPQSVQPQSSNAQAMVYSGEDQAALSQVSQSNTVNNQVTTPYYDGFMNQPKSSAFSNENVYKPTAKIQFSAYPAITDFTSSIPILTLPIQAAASTNYHQAHVPASQNTPYKPQLPHGIRGLQAATKIYAPLHRHDQRQVQQQQFENPFQNFGQNPYDVHYATAPSVDLNGKKLALPVLQLQTPDISSYIQAIEAAPVIFGAESGLHYKTDPNFSFDFSKPNPASINQRSGTNSPFLVAANPGPVQVLPVQTSSSSAQFPKYKGASVGSYTNKGFTKIPNDYQEFKSQTQLHFNGNPTTKPKTFHNPVYHPKILGEIRSDVEIINKKKPIPPLPKDDGNGEDDDDSREGYSGESYFPKNHEEEIELVSKKYFKEGELESDFKPSKSFPFKDYENKFNKHKKLTSSDDDDDDDSDHEPKVNLAAKYRFLGKAEETETDSDDDNGSAEEKPQSNYKAYHLHDSFGRSDNDDDEVDERDTHKHQAASKKIASDDEDEQRASRKPKSRKERGRSYAEDFEDSFKKKYSKPKFSQQHTKGSSEFSEDRIPSSNLHRSETTRAPSSKSRPRIYRDEKPSSSSGRSSTPFSSASTRYEARSSENSDGRPQQGTKFGGSSEGSKMPKINWDSYGSSKSGEDTSERSSYSREESDGEKRIEQVTRKPLSSSLSDITTRSSARPSATPKGDTEDTDSSTYVPRGGNWKSETAKTKPSHPESYSRPSTSAAKSLINSKKGFFNPTLGHGEIFRSLKGI